MEADPKSASFTCPGSVSRMFPALISLIIEYKRQDYSSPKNIESSIRQTTKHTRFSPNTGSSIFRLMPHLDKLHLQSNKT